MSGYKIKYKKEGTDISNRTLKKLEWYRTFLMDLKNLTVDEAIRISCKKYGVPRKLYFAYLKSENIPHNDRYLMN